MPTQIDVTFKVCKFYDENCGCFACRYARLEDKNREFRGRLAVLMQAQAERDYADKLYTKDITIVDIDPFFQETV